MRILLIAILAAPLASLGAEGLGGSPSSMRAQHEVAVTSDYSFFATPKEVNRSVEAGRLVEIRGNADYRLSKVSFPFARPEVSLFIERFAAQYRDATGGTLVVTSLTRPSTLQPRNAHALSVHPAGMAIDLRVPANAAERAWIEQTLLELERAKVLDVTRERSPAHYHVAIYPEAYRAYAAARPMPPRAPAAVKPVLAAMPRVAATAGDNATPLRLFPIMMAALIVPFALMIGAMPLRASSARVERR